MKKYNEIKVVTPRFRGFGGPLWFPFGALRNVQYLRCKCVAVMQQVRVNHRSGGMRGVNKGRECMTKTMTGRAHV